MSSEIINNKTILITGGTGSFGTKLTEVLFRDYKPKKVIIFSRDEFKQFEMAKNFPDSKYPIRYFLGDIRDKDRLYRAFDGVDYVIHAAALKQVPALEYNPMEAVKTNVLGADCIVDAAIDMGVEKVVALSTDKAVNPVNLYGATKLVSEKVFTAANSYSAGKTNFSVVRYGNVVGSRGSIIPFLNRLKSQGIKEFPITDERMTRFWITLEESVELVLTALRTSIGGEVFVPIIPSMKITDLAKAIDPDCTFKFIGIRPGEKVHETLVSEDEARKTFEGKGVYIIMPQFHDPERISEMSQKYKPLPENFIYRSDLNKSWVSSEQLKDMIAEKKTLVH